MFKSFHRAKSTAAASNVVEVKKKPREVAPGTDIAYDAGLIRKFKADHQALLETLAELRTAVTAHQFAETNPYLARFKSSLTRHMLEEDVRLYTYLSHCLQDDRRWRKIKARTRNEMNTIGHMAIEFARQYLETGVNNSNIQQFVTTLDEVADALAERIHQEETSLYALYRPPTSFVSQPQVKAI